MSRVVVLDAGPLGLVTKRRGIAAADACRAWVDSIVDVGGVVLVPEIADYEVRRELIRTDSQAAISRLNTFIRVPGRYVGISTEAMRKAAELWAESRNRGRPTADPHALDGDVILAGQALSLGFTPSEIIVATVNVDHISRYLSADRWENIAHDRRRAER